MKKSTRIAGHTERETKVVRYAIEHAKNNNIQVNASDNSFIYIDNSFFDKEIEEMKKIPRKEIIKEAMIEIQNTDRKEMSIWSKINEKEFIDLPQSFCDFLQKKIKDGLIFEVCNSTDSKVIIDAIIERVKQCYPGAVLVGEESQNNNIIKPVDYVFTTDIISRKMFNNELKRGEPNVVTVVPDEHAGALVLFDFTKEAKKEKKKEEEKKAKEIAEEEKKEEAKGDKNVILNTKDFKPATNNLLEEAKKDKNVRLTTDDFKPFIRLVHDAVTTLWAAGYKVVSNTDILRAMPGNPEAKMTLKHAKDIHNAMTFLNQQQMLISTSMDEYWTNVDNKKNLHPEKELPNSTVAPAYRGRFIDFREIGFALGKEGKIRTMITVKWELLACPILYQYAEAKNQIGRVPIKQISTHNVCNNSIPRISSTKPSKAIVSYLIQRIEGMKHNPSLSNTILYSHIYECLGLKHGQRTQASRARNKVKDMLHRFVINGYIIDYEELPMKGAIHGEKKGVSIKF